MLNVPPARTMGRAPAPPDAADARGKPEDAFPGSAPLAVNAVADVLIVDDRPENVVALEEALAGLGLNILRAYSGQEALATLLGREVAVILLDVRMPEMSGLEAARYIRMGKSSRNTPIILVTAGDDHLEEVARGYSAGAVDYIQKPFHVGILRSKVKVFADLYLATKEIVRKAEALAGLNEELRASVEERKRAEEEIRAAYKELEVFTHTVAHDLRAPLRAMMGFSEILREEYSEKPFDEAGREYTRRIEDGAHRMDALIRDLLSYCRVAGEKVELESLDPGPIPLEAARRETAGLPEGKGDIRVSGEFPRVLGNPGLLSQALESLVSNAVKFVGPGVSPRIEIGYECREGRVRLFVSDNGIGIEPEYHDRIFLVFERLHDQSTYPGTGMGLAIVRAAAGKLGGRVGLESKPGQGSRFWIELEAAR